MKNRLIILLVMFLLLGLAISDVAARKVDGLFRDFSYTFYGGSDSISLIDENTARGEEAIELALPDEAELKKLIVLNEMGDINVSGVAGRDYAVTGNLTVYALTQEDAEAYLGQVEVQLRQEEDSYILELSQSGTRPSEVHAVKMDLEILVPLNVSLYARTTGGLLKTAGLAGSVELDAQFGQIVASELAGDLAIKGIYSDIAISKIEGNVQMETHFKEANIEDVAGSLELTSFQTDFSVENVTNGVNLNTRFGNGLVKGVNGNLEYDSDHANINFSRIGGNITGASRHGRISIREPQEDLDLKGEFCSVDLLISSGSEFRLTGEAEFTSINSDFDLVTTKDNHHQTISYLQGGGTNTYKLDLRHGDLQLIKTGN